MNQASVLAYVFVNKLVSPVWFKVINNDNKTSWEAMIASGDSIMFNAIGDPGAVPFYSNSEGRIGNKVTINFGNKKCTNYERDLSTGIYDGTGVFKLSNYDNYSIDLVNQKQYRLVYSISDKDIKIAQECE